VVEWPRHAVVHANTGLGRSERTSSGNWAARNTKNLSVERVGQAGGKVSRRPRRLYGAHGAELVSHQMTAAALIRAPTNIASDETTIAIAAHA
jgi:hypothetical protein